MVEGIVELALANLLYYFNWKLPNRREEEDLNKGTQLNSLKISKKTRLIPVPIHYLHQPSETA